MLKKIVRWLLFGVACLVTLIALLWAEENWRGKRAWEWYKQALEAQGERLTLLELAPVPVPDDRNFATTPLLKPLFPQGTNYAQELEKRLALPAGAERKKQPGYGDWATARPIDLKKWQEYFGSTNILQVLHKFDPELDEISAASQRPYARFPVRYEDGFMMLLPHLTALRQLARLYVLRASAELEQGQTDRAATDIAAVLRLASSVRDDPLLISQLVRIAILQIGLQPVWEGLCRHQWSDSQLVILQNELQRMDFLAGGLQSMRCERAGFNDIMASAINGSLRRDSPYGAYGRLPRGMLYQNVLAANRFYQDSIVPTFSLAERKVDPEKVALSDARLKSMRTMPYNFFIKLLMPALSEAYIRFARAQAIVDEAMIACALERCRLAHGQFPDNLDALVPQFLANLPHDVISGQPLKYRRTDDGGFVLYSVGWNETDDGGKVALTKNGALDPKSGDWVWFSKPQPSASEQK